VKWKNGLAQAVLPLPLPAAWVAQLPLFVQSWWANCVLCYVEYFATAALWALWIYRWYPNAQVAGKHPSREAMWAQIGVSCRAIPLYTLLPPLSEHLILSGHTRVYGRLSSVSPAQYLAQVACYLLCVEFGVYWMHRKLHEVKWAYSWLHRIHHVYNKEHTLSPFAGLAFHPLDGLLQAVPYVWSLFLVPTHYFTHEVLLFATGLWTANIHDCIHGRCEPIMGAAYHAIHHTTYKHNYGHYTTLFDSLFGTLERPKAEAQPKAASVKAQ
jgi:lathosterol oxidase